MSPLQLGCVELREQVGAGSGGRVWRGFHQELGCEVAVKVLMREANARFRAELHAFAALDHPAVVRLFDYGAVGGSEAVDQRLTANTPYMVLEFVRGRSLAELATELDWGDLRAVLVQLLDALAHAHARGVIHRDLKPENVLIADDFQVKLTDFGVALGTSTGGVSNVTRRQNVDSEGTPNYMAPEQITGLWHDQGPWTDLYALGCLAWELVAGAPPFHGETVMSTLIAQVNHPLPALEPRIDAPPGVEIWLRRLLEKEPEKRYGRAADAAWDLLALEQELDEDAMDDTFIDRALSAPMAIHHPDIRYRSSAEMQIFDPGTTTEEMPTVRPVLALRPPNPPIPEDWRAPERSAEAGALGAAIQLFGMRPLPMVGRVEERDALWASLRVAWETMTPQVAVVVGPTGCGKSRLVEWLVQRAHELGAATLLAADHGSRPGGEGGLEPMLRRFFRCEGEEFQVVEERVTRFLEANDFELETLVPVLTLLGLREAAQMIDGTNQIRFSPVERYGLIRRIIGAICRQRPVILWLDNVQWGLDAMMLAETVLDAANLHPVLVVLTVSEEDLAERPSEAALLHAMRGRPGCLSLALDNLKLEQATELARNILRLEPELAREVVTRTDGNPLFMTQLVGDWIHRERLEAGPEGLRLQRGPTAPLPDSLHEVWTTRLEHLLKAEPKARAALELAAVLGRQVQTLEWVEACTAAGMTPCLDLVQAMMREGLVLGQGGDALGISWAFAYAALRESLERSATEAGRLESAHAAAAAMLQRVSRPDVVGRLGYHLAAAGHVIEALQPLLDGAQQRVEAGDFPGAEVMLGQRESVCQSLDGHRAHVENHLLRARLAMLTGRWDEARDTAGRAVEAAGIGGWPDLAIRGLLRLAETARAQGRLGVAWQRAEDATSWARRHGERGLLAEATQLRGHVMQARGAFDAAAGCFREALADFEAVDSLFGQAQCLEGLGMVARLNGAWEEADETLVMARELYERAGARLRGAAVTEALGEVARDRGDLDSAELLYSEALKRYHGLGAVDALHTRARLALVAIQRGQYAAVRVELMAALEEAERLGMLSLLTLLHAALLPAVVEAEDRAALRRHLSAITSLCDETGVVDRDVAVAAQRAGELAEGRDDPVSAWECYSIARDHWRGLGVQAEAERVEALIARTRGR